MNDSLINDLVEAILEGDQSEAMALVKKLLKAGTEKEKIVTDGIESAMEKLDAKCTIKQFNLLEIMLSGRAVMGIMKELYPQEEELPMNKGSVILGSLEGDVHDLGKNIFKMALTASGYRVVDCGKDCNLERLIDAAEREKAIAVGVSGLITTVIPQVQKIKELIEDRGLINTKALVGGAALKQSKAVYLNVDYVAQNTFDGLKYLNSIITAG